MSIAAVCGSLSSAEVRPLGSARNCAARACRIAGARASTSTLRPSRSAFSGVTRAAMTPACMRAASVQKPSLPKVSNRKTCRPAEAIPPRRGAGTPAFAGLPAAAERDRLELSVTKAASNAKDSSGPGSRILAKGRRRSDFMASLSGKVMDRECLCDQVPEPEMSVDDHRRQGKRGRTYSPTYQS